MNLLKRLGISIPIIQAPMAGVQGSALAIAVSNAGGLGSLPTAMFGADAMRAELKSLRAGTNRPFNVNCFCHAPPVVDAARETAWRNSLGGYYREFAIDPNSIPEGGGRRPFDAGMADLLSEFAPPVVSFHFGLPSADLVDRVKAWGALVLSSATTVDEARWLEDHGADAIIAQGVEAGGHRGMFLTSRHHDADRHVCAAAADRSGGESTGGRGGRHRRRQRRGRGDDAGRGGGAGRQRLSAVSGSNHDCVASRRAQERCGAPHRGDERVHRPPGARHRQSRRSRARSDVGVRSGVSVGRCRTSADPRQSGGARQRRLLADVVRAEPDRLPRDSGCGAHSRAGARTAGRRRCRIASR